MKIYKIIWPSDRVDHIAKHGISPEEFEEACFGNPFVLRSKSEGQNPVYYAYGQTIAGRYLLCIVIEFPDGNGFPVTARDMDESERRRFRKQKRS
jgi:uncharacterized DUF497 family protein